MFEQHGVYECLFIISWIIKHYVPFHWLQHWQSDLFCLRCPSHAMWPLQSLPHPCQRWPRRDLPRERDEHPSGPTPDMQQPLQKLLLSCLALCLTETERNKCNINLQYRYRFVIEYSYRDFCEGLPVIRLKRDWICALSLKYDRLRLFQITSETFFTSSRLETPDGLRYCDMSTAPRIWAKKRSYRADMRFSSTVGKQELGQSGLRGSKRTPGTLTGTTLLTARKCSTKPSTRDSRARSGSGLLSSDSKSCTTPSMPRRGKCFFWADRIPMVSGWVQSQSDAILENK